MERRHFVTIDRLVRSIIIIRAERDVAEAEVAALNEEINKLNAENAALKKEKEKLKNDVSSLANRLALSIRSGAVKVFAKPKRKKAMNCNIM